ncbi:MAG: bifunctional alpha,alpha-trehalose-phosphate synthase (UDP-forming)/trehalose-phosphatase [Leptospiraceae bacterium]|nr:bifunctional alpha,alpha-trehalose-phosphate synthase (UDP-forming)/trehalose-phosphatase [Leptospiraceae bacterium]
MNEKNAPASQILFVANRLPVTIHLDGEQFQFTPSIGGLATGLKSYTEEQNATWLGWPGLASDDLTSSQIKQLDQELLEKYRCHTVHLQSDEMELFYHGFSNSTLWPLFHYFSNLTQYQSGHWEAYQAVNERFLDKLAAIIQNGDTVWIHDYQLMLLPGLIRNRYPDCRIGFFLHIPFPSYELFRLIPWRSELLFGLLGSDLIGFHTYDYARHFLSSVRRILGLEHNLNFINFDHRRIKIDVFPMGIDYQRFSTAIENKEIRTEMVEMLRKTRGTQVILSVDRLDYTKGIPERLKAYALFLEQNENYKEKVTLILIVAPSRTSVDTYDGLRREIEELVSNINGSHGTMGWVPVWFFFRSFTIENLMAFYQNSDAMLVTPLRDGMNLVAKEYIASRFDKQGMLIISETAGAASELGEAILVNPNDQQQIASAIKRALEMTRLEQMERNGIMHQRLARYDVRVWARDFLDKLARHSSHDLKTDTISLDNVQQSRLIQSYDKAHKRLILLDYDGTLKPFTDKPEDAWPEEELQQLLQQLQAVEQNMIVLVSGRDRDFLERWFGQLGIALIGSHGLWIKNYGADWQMSESLDNSWKADVRPVLELYMDRTPGSLVEEKEHSLAWHYRRCEPELANIRLNELRDALISLVASLNVGILEGNKVLEVKNTMINKGRAANQFLRAEPYDFVLAAGDDVTDEDLFAILDDKAWSIKVGKQHSKARFSMPDPIAVRLLLAEMLSSHR